MSESKTTCRVCQKAIVRIFTGTSGNRKLYEDDKGESWMGRKCPACAKELNKERMRKKRS